MYIKKLKRKCSVRGCKNTECFAISRSRELGNSIIICKSCLQEALVAVDENPVETKLNISALEASAPSLFFNAKALGTEAETKSGMPSPVLPENGPQGEKISTVGVQGDSSEETTPEEEPAGFICSLCGKKFESEKRLNAHLRYCKATNTGVQA